MNDASFTYRMMSWRWLLSKILLVGSVVLAIQGCKLVSAVDNAETPSDLRDPKSVQNEMGAFGMYRGVLNIFATAVGIGNTTTLAQALPRSFITMVGVFTDELETLPAPITGGIGGGGQGVIDLRFFPNIDDVANIASFEELHNARVQSREARGNIRKYGPNLPTELLSHLYAIEGFSEVLLAELFCSGIPLSSIDFDGGVTFTRGFLTDEVYDHAIVLFDSALALAGDSVRFRYLAHLGKARAYLGKGDVAAAVQAAQPVPVDYRYTISYVTAQPKFTPIPAAIKRSDREGHNGLPFISSGDPRTALPQIMNPTAPLIFATGIETLLLKAEAAVQSNDPSWLVTLNTLRTTCVVDEPCPSPAPAGLGGIANLPPLDDPAAGEATHEDSVRARIDLVFAERAYWFYLTGRRQGDLRRLVRHYQRPQILTYPTGLWGAVGANQYGDAVVIPPPFNERRTNPFYRGCEHFDA